MVEVLRCFVAIELTESIRAAIAACQDQLNCGERGIKWVSPERMHLTLRFLGNVAESDIPGVQAVIDRAVTGVGRMKIDLVKVECYPSVRRPSVVWVGCRDFNGVIGSLVLRLETGLEELGFPRERRPFQPHITMARLRNPANGGGIVERLESMDGFTTVAMTADWVTLYRSELTRTGPNYSVISRHTAVGGSEFPGG